MTPEERRDVPRRLDAAKKAREERGKRGEQTELENARQVIRELRRELEAQASRVREAEARGVPDEAGCKAARVEAAKLRADVEGLELELEALRSAKKADDEFLIQERDEAKGSLAECRRVWQGFITDCADLLGLPKLDGCSEYGGGAIRRGIRALRGSPEEIKATMEVARGLVAVAWCQKKTSGKVMDVDLAEEFAKILFPFLETLEFYALLGNWQSEKSGHHESACDRDLGGRARAAMGRPDRDVLEIIKDGDDGTT